MRTLWPLLLLLACTGETPDTDDTDADATDEDTDAGDTQTDTDDDADDTADDDSDAAETDEEGPTPFSVSYGSETPATTSTTAGWDGWTSVASAGGAFGVGTSTALDVRGGFSGQVGYITLTPNGTPANLTLRADATWQAPGAGYTVRAFVMLGKSISQAAGSVSMTLKPGTDTRRVVPVSSGSWTLAGQINQPMEIIEETFAEDAGKTFSVEITVAAPCCASVQHLFEGFEFSATPPAN